MVVGFIFLFVAALSAAAHSAQKPEWDPNTYDQDYANNTLMFAYGAYCDASELKSWTCKWCQYVPGFQVDAVVDHESLQAFTGYDSAQKQVVISFRGTQNTYDWLYDLDQVKIDYPGVNGGKVHKGFYDAWQILKPDVMASAEKLMSKYFGNQILVTGHSLGASIAQIAALDVASYANSTQNTGYRIVQDFGSPRWCNDVMVGYFKSSIDVHWRVVNVHDVVPTVPYEAEGFHHTPHEVWYTSDSPLKYQLCDGSGEDPDCSYIKSNVADHLHYMNLYETCVDSS